MSEPIEISRNDIQVGDSIVEYVDSTGMWVTSGPRLFVPITSVDADWEYVDGTPWVDLKLSWNLRVIRSADYTEVDFAGLKVGDYLVAYESIVDGSWKPVGKLVEQLPKEPNVLLAGFHTFWRDIKRKYRIRKSAAPVASADSRYPKQCQKCGKGIYVGMNDVDHEGGPCPKG